MNVGLHEVNEVPKLLVLEQQSVEESLCASFLVESNIHRLSIVIYGVER